MAFPERSSEGPLLDQIGFVIGSDRSTPAYLKLQGGDQKIRCRSTEPAAGNVAPNTRAAKRYDR